MSARTAVVLLGAGNVAAALARAFLPNRPVRVWARRPGAAASLVDEVSASPDAVPSKHGISAHEDLRGALAGDVHAVLLAVTDGALASLAAQLSELPRELLAGPVCMHLSGYHGTGVLAPLPQAACLHPNAAIMTGAGPEVFRGAHFGIGGEGACLERARELALELGGKPLVVADGDRPRYHAAATLLASGMVGLFGKAEDLLTGVLGEGQRDEARALLRGLLASTASNLQQGAAGDVLTGPLARRDHAVIRGHEGALGHPELAVTRDLYRAASAACQQLPRDRSPKEPASAPDAEPDPPLHQRVVVTLGPADVGWVEDHFEVAPAALVWRLDGASIGAVELRLDLCLPSPEVARGVAPERLVELLVEEVAALVRPLPLLAACHPVGSPGTAGGFQGSAEQRLALLGVAARSGVRYLDLDPALVELVIARLAGNREVDLGAADFVLSNHLALSACEPLGDEDWRAMVEEGTAGLAPDPSPQGDRVNGRLDRALFAGLAREAALDAAPRFAGRVAGHKLVGVVERPEEALELLGWGALRRRCVPSLRGRLAVFAGGTAGSFARVLAPRFGADFLYAAARSSGARVPGQLGVLDLLRSWPRGSFARAAESRVLGVLGHPVAGSLSPALFRRLDDESYPDDLVFARFDFAEPDAVLRFAARFDVCLSVTAPHKGAALRFAVNSTDRALRSIGAANTLVQESLAVPGAPSREPGETRPLLGFNTDVAGVLAALEELFAGDGPGGPGGFLAQAAAAPGRPVVVLGAGGAARAVLAAVRGLAGGAGLPLVVLARSP
ncbi:MAG: type I 3-dehydroquinate dehydratase [Planctomycetota bacterium]|nr:type I 3-dehydroquinate dehydratase [Planctomycetota bacterium]